MSVVVFRSLGPMVVLFVRNRGSGVDVGASLAVATAAAAASCSSLIVDTRSRELFFAFFIWFLFLLHRLLRSRLKKMCQKGHAVHSRLRRRVTARFGLERLRRQFVGAKLFRSMLVVGRWFVVLALWRRRRRLGRRAGDFGAQSAPPAKWWWWWWRWWRRHEVDVDATWCRRMFLLLLLLLLLILLFGAGAGWHSSAWRLFGAIDPKTN
jgi:hypothetical protein